MPVNEDDLACELAVELNSTAGKLFCTELYHFAEPIAERLYPLELLSGQLAIAVAFVPTMASALYQAKTLASVAGV